MIMDKTRLQQILEEKDGVLNLIPVFVPRLFGSAGRRLRLHPDDYFALGTERGTIKERWFSSIICANNGPKAAADEGMSYVNLDGKLENKVIDVSSEIDDMISRRKLAAWGITIDTLTPEQKAYLSAWDIEE